MLKKKPSNVNKGIEEAEPPKTPAIIMQEHKGSSDELFPKIIMQDSDGKKMFNETMSSLLNRDKGAAVPPQRRKTLSYNDLNDMMKGKNPAQRKKLLMDI